MSNNVIGAVFKIKDQFSSEVKKITNATKDSKKAFDETSKSTKGFGDALKDAGKTAGVVGKSLTKKLTLPLVGIGVMAIKTVATFDDAMANVQKISGATGKDFDNLRDKAKELGSTTAYSATEASEGMGVLASSGMKTNDIIAVSKDMFNLMSAGMIDADTSASILTNTMSQFSLTADDSEYIVDTFASTMANAKVSVADLEYMMSQAGATLASMNMTVAESTAVFGHLGNAGLPIGQLGSIVNAMGREVKQNADEFKKIGINVYDPVTGKLKVMGDVMGELEEAVKGKSDTERDSIFQTVFSGQAMQGATAWIKQGTEAYNELTEAITKETKVAETMANIQENTVAGAFRAVKSATEGFLIDMGDVIKGPIQQIALKVVDVANAFGELSEPMKKAIVVIGTVAMAVGPLLWAFSKVITIGGIIGPVLVTAFGALTSPITLTIGAVVGLIAVGVMLYQNWEIIGAKIETLIPGITETMSNGFETIKDIVTTVTGAISDLWDTHKDDIMETVTLLWELVKNVFLLALGVIAGVVAIGVTSITFLWDTFGEGIKLNTKLAWDIISNIFSVVLGVIKGIIQIALGVITLDWNMAWQGMKTIVTSIWDGIKGVIRAGVDYGIAQINRLIGMINKIPLVNIGNVGTPRATQTEDINSNSDLMSLSYADGSHKSGKDRIPFDGYRAVLHKDEMVLNRGDANSYRQGNPTNTKASPKSSTPTVTNSRSNGINITIQEMNVRQESDIDKIASMLARKLQKTSINMI